MDPNTNGTTTRRADRGISSPSLPKAPRSAILAGRGRHPGAGCVTRRVAFRRIFANPAMRRLQLAWACSNIGAWMGGLALAVFAFQRGRRLRGRACSRSSGPSARGRGAVPRDARRPPPRVRVMVASDLVRRRRRGDDGGDRLRRRVAARRLRARDHRQRRRHGVPTRRRRRSCRRSRGRPRS